MTLWAVGGHLPLFAHLKSMGLGIERLPPAKVSCCIVEITVVILLSSVVNRYLWDDWRIQGSARGLLFGAQEQLTERPRRVHPLKSSGGGSYLRSLHTQPGDPHRRQQWLDRQGTCSPLQQF